MTKWVVCSIILGAISLALGIAFLYGAIAVPGEDMLAIDTILGILGTAGGICGITGGLCIKRNSKAARELLLAAAVTLISYALFFSLSGLFFFLFFMVARNRVVQQDMWGEEKP